MRVKDTWKLLTIGDTKLTTETEENLKHIGFLKISESKGLNLCGRLIWEVDDYEVCVEYWYGHKQYNEGVEKEMEIIGEGFYGEIFRVSPIFIIHLATGFDEYYSLYVVDKEELETIGFMRITEGFIFCGNRKDISKALTSLVQTIPVQIKIC
jgi:hypothetical protein